jgi:hypothetical protein
MQQRPSWEADSRLADQEIPHFYKTRVQKSPPLYPILEMNAFYTLFIKSILILTLHQWNRVGSI